MKLSNLQDSSWSAMAEISQRWSQPASRKSQGCWIFWMMVAATWLTQWVIVTRQVGQTWSSFIVITIVTV